MAVIDILTLSNDGNPAVYQVPTFTVNTAVSEVTANFNAVPNFFWGVFSTPSGLNVFEPQDNVRILSMWIVLPFCFGLGSTVPRWGLVWKDALTTTGYTVPEWSTDGQQWIPTANIEIPIDQYLPHNPLLGPPYSGAQLAIGIMNLTISMINVPAALNGTTQDIQIALKVLHNSDLT